MARIVVGSVLTVVILAHGADPADAQLDQTIFRSMNGQIYQILQHSASADAGIGVDEVRITTIAGSSTGTTLACAFPGDTAPPLSAEAWAFAAPAFIVSDLSLIRTSSIIGGAGAPFFNSAGDGTVCIGPGCQFDATCVGGASMCATFTRDSGDLITSGTNIPAAALSASLSPTTNCPFGTQASYAVGTGGGDPTRVSSLCVAPPTDGFVLDDSPSVFTGGIAGETIIIVYDNLPFDPFSISAAGFGVDTDGDNGGICPAMSNVVVNAVADQDTAPPPAPTPTPTGIAAATPTPTATNIPVGCPASPAEGCLTAGKGILLIKDKAPAGASAKDKLVWKWLKGPALTQVDFGDPVEGGTGYQFCLYDSTGHVATITVSSENGSCGTQPCWKAVSDKGYKFKDKTTASDGVKILKLKANGEGKSKIILKGKDANLPLPTLPLDDSASVLAQLMRNDAVSPCFETDFTGPVLKNASVIFKGKF